ncbi:DUF4861 domain-containing protein [Carboxylicivirga sp. N1Y90]|uniref:DUF4861 domain-containing protein n=1 Tax=Carboxylicivirga fragile TaxID=3417571 RepID=UPI003D349BB6|nr:DUF4861 domain-containing protein [Marinilabiliaceae bacterium N1Y90]
MDNKLKGLLAAILSIVLISCASSEKKEGVTITVSNDASVDFIGLLEINPDSIDGLNAGDMLQAFHMGNVIATQWCDTNGDGKENVLCVEVALKAKEKKQLYLVELDESEANVVFENKTQAELWHKTTGKFKEGRYVGGGNFSKFDSLRVPDGFMDHAYFIKYEGPGWESDKVGYRLYLDWRNAIDVFGKRVSQPILQDVGVDGYESYHHLEYWGMDVLKVGKSLGLGSTGWWDGEKAIRVEQTDSVSCRILSSGIMRSQVQIWYNGWQLNDSKVNLISLKSIDAGSRMTHEHLSFDKAIKNICTGIRIEPETKIITIEGSEQKWACLATWGKQSLNADHLGLAILYPLHQDAVITKDKDSHVVVFEKALQVVDYYFLAAWELEKDGISSEADFVRYLEDELNKLENPLTLTK